MDICHQLNKRYRIEIKQKVTEYYNSTEYIRKERTKLRNLSVPRIIVTSEGTKHIYSDKFYVLDKQLSQLQDIIWNAIFKKEK